MKFVQSACQNLWHGFLSAGAWAVIWSLTFFLATSLVEMMVNNADGITITAFSLTITVISGRVAKIISCAIGGDADFKHLFLMDERRQRVPPKHFRFVFSMIFVAAAIYLILGVGQDAILSQKVVDARFFPYSVRFWYVILFLFFSQMVFSWPEPLVKSEPLDGS